jgi:hypothetical protein
MLRMVESNDLIHGEDMLGSHHLAQALTLISIAMGYAKRISGAPSDHDREVLVGIADHVRMIAEELGISYGEGTH